MLRIIIALVFFNLVAACLVVNAEVISKPEQAVHIQWADLQPSTPQFNDPFTQLTPRQLDDLGYYVGLQQDIQRLKMSQTPLKILNARQQALSALKVELEQQGIDITFLLSQRDIVKQQRFKHATAVNDALLGRGVTMIGYAVPTRVTEAKLSAFFIVEDNPLFSIGHAHHVPNPNQVVHVILDNGIAFESLDFKQPLQVSGVIKQGHYEKEIAMPDGHKRTFQASYTLNPANETTPVLTHKPK